MGYIYFKFFHKYIYLWTKST